ncbi:hypothetical protein [Neolewinella agarilytica]|uniref:Uncharacterized protein n=1 Tax=Neolewinella agarilytica TaxID=478744 RepID=A0A1H9MT30_9BACT|nr:hypothetical protein [Neolewinella agarilytica]SER26585.1 hypothetical protein SAMN05444359_13126 [Neolewinella agarilytica]
MRALCFLVLSLLLASCATDPAGNWSELDLTAYNLPVKIMAPDSAKVISSNLSSIMRDVTIKSEEDDYSIQILASQASTNDMTRLKAEQLELVRDNRYFSKVVREEDNGFIFENQIDSTSIFGFRYIIYQGDQEFVFQNGFDATYGLEAIEAMYSAVKQKK